MIIKVEKEIETATNTTRLDLLIESMYLTNVFVGLFLVQVFHIEQYNVHGETVYCSLHFIVDYPLWALVTDLFIFHDTSAFFYFNHCKTYKIRANQDYFRTNTLLTSYIYRNLEGLNELYANYRFPYGSKTKNVTIQFFVHGITSKLYRLIILMDFDFYVQSKFSCNAKNMRSRKNISTRVLFHRYKQ